MLAISAKVGLLAFLLLIAPFSADAAMARPPADDFAQPRHDAELWTLIGRWSYGPCQNVAVDGDRVYLDSGSHLKVLDFSDVSAPSELAEWETPGPVAGIAVGSGFVAIACGEEGLRLIDVSKPSALRELGSYRPEGSVDDVAILGDVAYIIGSEISIQTVDVSDPTAPALLSGTLLALPAFEAIVTDGETAFVAAYLSRLYAFDVSDPRLIRPLGSIELSGYPVDLAMNGKLVAVLASHSGLHLVDVGDPESVTAVGFLAIPHVFRGIALAGDHGFLASANALCVVDLSNPTKPALLGTSEEVRRGVDLAISGNALFVADEDRGLLRFDMSEPAAPTLQGRCELPGQARQLALGDGILFIKERDDGLRMLDIRDPSRPRDLGSYATGYPIVDLVATEAALYVSGGQKGLRILDASNPPELRELGHCEAIGSSASLAVSGGIAYVLSDEQDLFLVEVSDPEAPTVLGQCPTWSPSRDIWIGGGLACVAGWNEDQTVLQVFDVQDPAHPHNLGVVDTEFGVKGIVLRDGIAYIAYSCGYSEHCLRIMQIGDLPSGPALGRLVTESALGTIAVGTRVVYAVDWQAGVRVVDIEDLADPREIGLFESQGLVWDIALKEGALYIAEGRMGLSIVQYDKEASDPNPPPWPLPFRLGQNHPNPFNPRTQIPFELKQASSVSLTIFDLTGRCVRSLLNGTAFGAGPNSAHWDGTDDAGRTLPSGVYFYRLEVQGRTDRKRMLLLQ